VFELAMIETDTQHTLQGDLDRAFARVEAEIREHMGANAGEVPKSSYKVSVVLEIAALSTDLRSVTGHVATQMPKSGRKHRAVAVGNGESMTLTAPARQEPLPLEPGQRMAMVG